MATDFNPMSAQSSLGKFSNTFGNKGVAVDSANINPDKILRRVYPEYLTDDEYANRRITFIASTKTTEHYDTENRINLLTEGKEMLGEGINNIIDYVRGKKRDLVTDACVTLPLPKTIMDSQSHSWGTQEGFLSSLIGSGMESAKNSARSYRDNNAKGGGSAKQRIINSIGGMDISKAVGSFAESMGFRRPLINPNYWQMYQGSTPRAFNFNIDFIPQSQSEANLVKDIIKIFKAYASPELSLYGTTLISPHYWDVFISNDPISDMYRMDNLVLTQVGLQYGDGNGAMHGDGMPKKITMDLAFTESHLTYMQNYLNDQVTWAKERDSHYSEQIEKELTSGKPNDDKLKELNDLKLLAL